MCGIVGCISKDGFQFSYYVEDLFTNMLKFDSIRGEDSTGVFGVTVEGKVDWIKGNADGYLFTSTENYAKWAKRINKSFRMIIGHNRKATSGTISPETAHPFQEKHIILVHNGSVRNKDDIKKELEVDSQAIAHALAEHDPVTALSKIDGAYALVWYDKTDKSLNLARNSERPLYLVEYETYWAIASEPGLPIWLNDRESRKPKSIKLVPIEKILVFKLDNLKNGYFEVSYEEYKTWTAPVFQDSWSQRHTGYNPPYKHKESTTITNLMDQRRKKTSELVKFEAGSIVNFKLEDSKTEDGSEILIGNPIFGNDVDGNIVVRAVLPQTTTNDELLRYFDHEFYTGIVQNFRTLFGVPILFVKDIMPRKTFTDANKNQHDEAELAIVLPNTPCTKCGKIITMEEVKGAITRKNKQSGIWKIVCPTCLNATIAAVQQEKPGVNLRARVQ